MEQVIQAASGGKAESKAFNPADLLKMIDAAGGKDKWKRTKSAIEGEDINALAPFLQLLNQQISQINKSSDAIASSINGKEVTLEQGVLLFRGDITLKELQQVLTDFAQSGNAAKIDQEKNSQSEFSFDALLKEMDLLKNNLTSGDIKTAFETEPDKITDFLNNALAAKTFNSESEEKIITEKNIPNQPGGIILENEGKPHFVEGDPSKTRITKMDLKNIIGTKPDEENADKINPQLQPQDVVADTEIKFTAHGKDILKTHAGTLQPDKMIFQESQPSESTAGKITVNAVEVKEENKINKEILPDESGKENHNIRNNFRLAAYEMKESLMGKDNLRAAEVQYQNNANAGAGNKVQVETLQTIIGEVSEKVKAEQKGKTISTEIRNAEISLSPGNAAGSGSAATGKINNVSPDKIISQITNEIKENAANDGGRVKITLNPPSLGTLDMDVTVRNGKVEVVLVADNRDIQQTLNRHIDQLKVALQTQDLTIERCDVFMQDKHSDFNRSPGNQAFYHDRSRPQREEGKQEQEENKAITPIPVTNKFSRNLVSSADTISLFA